MLYGLARVSEASLMGRIVPLTYLTCKDQTRSFRLAGHLHERCGRHKYSGLAFAQKHSRIMEGEGENIRHGFFSGYTMYTRETTPVSLLGLDQEQENTGSKCAGGATSRHVGKRMKEEGEEGCLPSSQRGVMASNQLTGAGPATDQS